MSLPPDNITGAASEWQQPGHGSAIVAYAIAGPGMGDSSEGKRGTWRITDELGHRLAEYAGFGQKRHFAKDKILYDQGEVSTRFYLIRRGLVRISISKLDGTEVILEFMGPRTLCGEGSAFDRLPRFSRAVAVEDTEAIEFDTTKTDEIFARSPEFASILLRVTSLKQRVLAVRLEHLASRQPEERIIDLLSRLKEMFSVPYAKGALIATYLTHEQIAAMTGTTRVTVTRTLSRLRDQGVIDVVDRRILIRKDLP
jgi:CRP-like cAMP-binding protein